MSIQKSTKFLKLVVSTVALAAVALTAACGQSAAPVVAVEATDYSFSVPTTIQGGLTRIELSNAGQEPHHMQILKLNEGVSQAQFQAVLEGVIEALPTEGEGAVFGIFQVSTAAGGPSVINPGLKTSVVLDLEEGQYALVCFLPSPDGVPHLAKGMVSTLEVTAAPEDAIKGPEQVATITLNDFSFTGVPATLKAGESTIRVVHAGQEPHEMAVVKLSGISISQVGEMLSGPPPAGAPAGPPPFEFVGGYQAIMPGDSGWAVLDLEPGEYGLICLIPSPANEFKPHYALGMLASITVE